MVKESDARKSFWGVRWCLLVTFLYLEAYEVKGLGEKTTACFISAMSRGVGKPLDSCPSGKIKDGLLCYTPCKSGYYGVGPLCYQSCPSGTKDVGLLCISTYRKSCCCTSFGCCSCPPGYKNNGCFCSKSFAKDVYGRGTGQPLTCGLEKEQSGAICYESCSGGYHGVGPICWGQHSPTEFPFNCNDIIWAVDQATCDALNADLTKLGVSSTICAGVAFVSTSMVALAPFVPEVCNVPANLAITTIKDIINSTHAKTCP